MPEKKVLLVEDDRDSRDIYSLVLRHAGYQVIEATDGLDAVSLAQRHQPDVILMDLGLPQVDGWSAAETLKKNPATATIPIIAITVHVQEFYRDRAAVVGCDSFLDKPCSPLNLLEEIDRVLDAK